MFSCPATPETPYVTLYSLTTGTWTSVTQPGLCPSGSGDCYDWPVKVGAEWVEWAVQGCGASNAERCGYNFYAQNIRTGNVQPLPAHRTTYPNLDSPKLAAKLCRPLRVPTLDYLDWEENGGVPGDLTGDVTLHGQFAITYGGNALQPTIRLQRCGARTHTNLDLPNIEGSQFNLLPCFPPFEQFIAANAHEIIWINSATKLAGVFLPSMRRFMVPLPASLEAPRVSSIASHIALDEDRLYLLDKHGKLWTAPAPTIPGSAAQRGAET